MKEKICKVLSPLASVVYQRRYIIGSTKDNYIIPSEVLESIYSVLNKFENRPEFTTDMSEAEKRSVNEFRRFFKNMAPRAPSDDVAVTNEELVEHNPTWVGLRDAAKKCLDEMGFDLAAWEKKELSDGK